MALAAYSLSVPIDVLETGLKIVLRPVKGEGLPSLAELTAPRGFLPEEGVTETPTQSLQGGLLDLSSVRAPRGFLPA